MVSGIFNKAASAGSLGSPLELSNIEHAVQMGSMDIDQVNLTQSATLTSARMDERSQEKRRKDDKGLTDELRRVNEYLDKIDRLIAESQERIAELEAKREEATHEAQEAFSRMHELEDLLEDIKDGISPEERKRLIELLGPEAQNASDEDLETLIQLQIERERQQGLDKTQKIKDLDAQIQAERERLEKLEQERDSYETASSPEEREAIERRINDVINSRSENRPDASQEEVTKWYKDGLVEEASFDVPSFS